MRLVGLLLLALVSLLLGCLLLHRAAGAAAIVPVLQHCDCALVDACEVKEVCVLAVGVRDDAGHEAYVRCW